MRSRISLIGVVQIYGSISENAQFILNKLLKTQKITAQIQSELEQVLSLDPRPAYQDDAARIYKMKFANLDVSFTVHEHVVNVMDVQLL